MSEILLNYINGAWQRAESPYQSVRNPATAAVLAEVPLTPAQIVAQAVEHAHAAFLEWR
ncbi:MAG: methylmalonate-semialdehyde dehydrogenase (CoA acylating), partial [Candidatus Thermofonsia Clade 1 bacterium]